MKRRRSTLRMGEGIVQAVRSYARHEKMHTAEAAEYLLLAGLAQWALNNDKSAFLDTVEGLSETTRRYWEDIRQDVFAENLYTIE